MFKQPCKRMLLKTLWEKEKMVNGICSFSYNIFYPLTHYQTTNFRLFHIERLCRRKFEENGRKLFKPVENTVGKGEIAR